VVSAPAQGKALLLSTHTCVMNGQVTGIRTTSVLVSSAPSSLSLASLRYRHRSKDRIYMLYQDMMREHGIGFVLVLQFRLRDLSNLRNPQPRKTVLGKAANVHRRQWRIQKLLLEEREENVSVPLLFITNAHNEQYALYI